MFSKIKIEKKDVKSFLWENRLVFLFAIALFVKTLILNYASDILFLKPTAGSVSRTLLGSLLGPMILFSPLFFLPKKSKNIGSYAISIIFSLILIGDMVYFRYFKDFPSIGLLGGAGQIGDVLPALLALFRVSDLLIFSDVVLISFLDKKLSRVKLALVSVRKRIIFSIITTFLLVFMLAGFFFVDRNAFFIRALNNVYSIRISAEKYGFLIAHSLDIYRTAKQKLLKLSPEEEREVVEFLKNNSYVPTANEMTGIAKEKNVFLIQVESLTNQVVGKTIEGHEITPNINKLIDSSHYFTNHYFEIGGGSTSDTDFTINTSYYPITNESVFVKHGTRDFSSLPKELKREGYSTHAYHGYYGGFWNRQVAYSSLGFDKFFAAESYPEGYRVNMGLDDETFMKKTLEYVIEQPKPAYSFIVTLSNHYPFWLEHHRRLLELDEERYPGNVHGYVQTVRYTDEQVGHFIEGLKENGLYEDSVIVLYGDHNPHIDSYFSDELTIDNNSLDFRKVPMVIKLPGQVEQVRHNKVTSHIGFTPTLVNLVGIKPSYPMLGQDYFSAAEPFFAALWFFDIETIFKDKYRFRLFDGGVSTCEEQIGDNYIPTKSVNCEGFSDKKNEFHEMSRKAIYFNLFRYFKGK